MIYSIINPYTQKEIFSYSFTTLSDSYKSIELLKKNKAHLSQSGFDRSLVLLKLKELIFSHKEELAKLITLETGKVLKESLGEVDRACATLEISSEEAKRINGEAINTNSFGAQSDKIALIMKKPIGLVMCITPFNFPLNLALHKIGPAFAAGNRILFKPSEQCAQLSFLLLKLCYEAGMKEDQIQLIIPSVQTLDEIIQSPDIDCISFTGGTKTADKIAALCGRKKLLLELGGNDPLVVFDDADLNIASDTAIFGRFGSAGQRCTANKRVYVHESVYERFKTLLVEKSKMIKVSNPLDLETDIGPVISLNSANSIMLKITDCQNQGGKVLLGAKQEGAVIYPTIIESAPEDCELIREETFGPVIPLLKFVDEEDVIGRINSSEYGLQAGIFTNDLRRAKKFFNELEVGSVIMNDGPGFRQEHLPFGGVKSSGMGREGIKYAIDELSTTHSLIL